MDADAAPADTAPAMASGDSAPAADDERNTRARLRWRCRRGMRELDALLQRFFDRRYHKLSAADKQRFSQLLELPDPDLHDYLMGWYEAADPGMARLLARIRSL